MDPARPFRRFVSFESGSSRRLHHPLRRRLVRDVLDASVRIPELIRTPHRMLVLWFIMRPLFDYLGKATGSYDGHGPNQTFVCAVLILVLVSAWVMEEIGMYAQHTSRLSITLLTPPFSQLGDLWWLRGRPDPPSQDRRPLDRED